MKVLTVAFAFGMMVLMACSPDSLMREVGSGRDLAMPDAFEGKELYDEKCVACHGPTGLGDGPLAQGLQPSPSNLTLISAQNGSVFPRARVLSALDGYTRDATSGSAMPEFGALLEGDAVPVTLEDGTQSPVPRPLAALMLYLESLQQ